MEHPVDREDTEDACLGDKYVKIVSVMFVNPQFL